MIYKMKDAAIIITQGSASAAENNTMPGKRNFITGNIVKTETILIF